MKDAIAKKNPHDPSLVFRTYLKELLTKVMLCEKDLGSAGVQPILEKFKPLFMTDPVLRSLFEANLISTNHPFNSVAMGAERKPTTCRCSSPRGSDSPAVASSLALGISHRCQV
jgi:hypothetical protein